MLNQQKLLADKPLEVIVLGTMALDFRDAAVSDLFLSLQRDDFFYEEHRLIFDAISSLLNQNRNVDIVTITNRLRESSSLEAAGGVAYIGQLCNKIASPANLETHIDIIKDLAIRRNVASTLQNSLIKLHKDTPVDDVFQEIDGCIGDAHAKRSIEKEVTMVEIIDEFNRKIQEAKTLKGLIGTTTGRRTTDEILGGRQSGKLYVIAARPAMGKSALAMNEVLAAGIKGEPVAFFNLEMQNNETMGRMMAALATIDGNKISKGDVYEEEFRRIHDAQTKILNSPIFMFDNIRTLNGIVNKIKKLKRDKGIRTVYIDYLQLVEAPKEKGRNREQEVSLVSRTFKLLAVSENIAVVALSQLSRDVEKRPDRIPMLSDLRESGSIEQDSDVIEFIYRPEYYGFSEDEDGNPTEGILYEMIKKHRGGRLYDARYKFAREYSAITEIGERFLDGIAPVISKVHTPTQSIVEKNSDIKPNRNFHEAEKKEDFFEDDAPF